MRRSRFLDPAVLARVRDLRLVARAVVEGFLSGLHPDLRPGAGIDFSQYRSFEPGDDPRHLDWRLYARSDRFYVRQAEVERDVVVRLLLDASRSMAHGEGRGSKFDYARRLIAALAYLADLGGDHLAFHALAGGAAVDLAPRGRRGVLPELLARLEALEPAGTWPAWSELAPRLAAARSRQLVVVVSDLYQQGRELETALGRLAARGHGVLVLHLMARDELDFTFDGDLLFEDLETGDAVRGHADALRPAYRRRLERFLEGWRRRLLERRVDYRLIPTDQPLDHALRALLLRRRALR
ncbi:MAG: DUF58 domain-containing protein [Acidobacteria bacterium]|nr:MAG: DUF58 domain-containing protein [Acidobacteriota bacterium]